MPNVRKPSTLGTLILLTFSILFSACNKQDKMPFGNKFTLEKTGEIAFALDSMTKKEHSVVNFSQDYNSLCVFNDINHSIYFFDVSTQATTKVIPIEKEGPNGVSSVEAMLVHKRDSIFLYNPSTNKITLLNERAEVIRHFSFFDRNLGEPARVLSPEIYFNGQNLYLLGRVASFTTESKNKNIVKYIIEKDSTEFLMDYPASYQDGKWSSILMNKYANYDPASNNFIVSFPFDPFLYVFNEKLSETAPYYAGSDLMKQPEQITAKEKSSIGSYLLGNSWYGRLFYDPYNKTYLRSASIGYDMENTNTEDGKYSSNNRDGIFHVTIILDKDFQKVGEVINMDFYKTTFSTKEGIYIQDFEIDPENEDTMIFSRYQLVEIDNN